ncbi:MULTISPECIES: thermonuclease family protein [Alphaproteobacteria]|jgi:endonuclease YncB( thermonuclease family)|uniref:Thermonuclease family protein n=6 Tax=Paracoccus TaxID=265 RepID=A0A5C6S3X8_9RHOB|nr:MULTISPECIES: thermonuclease family protein [Alphaproteobacteria]MCV0383068.1 thermonuclease family protein [Erythrobacter sp.]ARC35530.1 thermonuclease family protein [Paracoccus yeei]AZY93319.1 thermonuclease family protein [Paracoccus sp. Arc7-R13]MBO6763741.1 thermonuclease family protein [Maricaulis sp.]MDP5305591.1 thermonuclease family protein [Paracoccus sp. 2205BS29-5]|tara:strand:+ start:1643 stop:2011 length:369 start_codon:yes stop_codon:yes gene_type:complete
MLSHIVVSILLCTASCEPAEIRVWDGDSIRLGTTRQSEAVRIFNIDAPEIEGQCAYETDLALQSKIRLAELLKGQRIEILHQGTDRYGRTLAAIRVEGRDVGDILVSEGLARTWAGRREPWC